MKVYLIGGGPGGGKSHVAEALGKKYELTVWRADDFAGPHQREAAAAEKYPVNSYINSLHEDEQALELIQLTAKQELARQTELFFMLLKELRSKNYNELIVEGNCLLPNLVKERFESEYRGVWLIPSKKFQQKLYPNRPWAPRLVSQSSNPRLTMASWIERDWQFNREIRRQAKAQGFPYLAIDGSQPLEYSIDWAAKNLGLEH